MYKWIGAVLIIAGCGGCGFAMAAASRREENLLRCLLQALEYMSRDLNCRATPLGALLSQAAKGQRQPIAAMLEELRLELERQILPDAGCCMMVVLERHPELPERLKNVFVLLGTSLGRFDLQGQLAALESVCDECRRLLRGLEEDRGTRLRTYQTLGLCAGAALAVVLL